MKLHSRALLTAVLFGLFAFQLLVSAPAHAQQALSEADNTGTRAVIEDQLSAFKSGDVARAWSHAAPSIQSIFPDPQSFGAMVQRGYLPLYAPGAHVFGRNMQVGEIVHQELIVTDQAGKQWQAVYTLMKQADGSWKITGVKMDPYNGASA